MTKNYTKTKQKNPTNKKSKREKEQKRREERKKERKKERKVILGIKNQLKREKSKGIRSRLNKINLFLHFFIVFIVFVNSC